MGRPYQVRRGMQRQRHKKTNFIYQREVATGPRQALADFAYFCSFSELDGQGCWRDASWAQPGWRASASDSVLGACAQIGRLGQHSSLLCVVPLLWLCRLPICVRTRVPKAGRVSWPISAGKNNELHERNFQKFALIPVHQERVTLLFGVSLEGRRALKLLVRG